MVKRDVTWVVDDDMKKMIVRIISLVFLSGCLFISYIAKAEDKKVYIVGVENNDYYPHYSFGYRRSIAQDILDRFAIEEGILLKYKSLPIKRLYNYLVDRKTIDLKYPDNPVWAKKEKDGVQIFYSKSVVKYTDGVHMLPSRENNSIAKLKRLGAISGFTPVGYLKAIEEGQITYLTFETYPKMMNSVIHGRLDGVYVNTDVAKYALETIGRKGELVINRKLPHVDDAFMLSSVKHPELIERFNLFLEKQKEWINSKKVEYSLPLN